MIAEVIAHKDTGSGFGNNLVLKILSFILLLLVISLTFLLAGLYFKWPFQPFPLISPYLCKEGNSNLVCQTDDIEIANPGWALYQFPKYGLSVEVPSYSVRQVVTDGKVEIVMEYFWQVKSFKMEESVNNSDIFSNYDGTVDITFLPDLVPNILSCGEGCLDNNTIRINFFRNTANLTVSDAERNFTSAIKKRQVEKNLESVIADTGFNKFKGWEAFTYVYDDISGQIKGHVVLIDDYIVLIEYFFSGEEESLNIANKVLESISFR